MLFIPHCFTQSTYLFPAIGLFPPQDAFDKLTVDSANQQASADAAAVTAADQNASFVEKAARHKASFIICDVHSLLLFIDIFSLLNRSLPPHASSLFSGCL